MGGDHAAPMAPLGGSVIVLGPPRSGVSSALRLLAGPAASSPHEPRDGQVLVPGPGSWADADLARALAADPHTVIVDEAHLLAGSATEDLILDWARRTDGRLVVGAELEAASSQFRGLVPHLARHRRGIILQPSAPRDGHLLGLAVPTGDVSVPGRGVLVDRGRAVRIHLGRVA